MLDALRQGAQGWVAKLLMLILVGSFGIWGITGKLSHGGASTVATVGGATVTAPEFARTIQQVERSGRQVAPEQVLNAMLLNAALDDEAAAYNLGISDDTLAKGIADDKRFQGANGQFDRDTFMAILRNAEVSQHDYVRGLKSDAVRQQIAGSLSAGLGVPQPMVEALYRFQNETRTVSTLTVDATAITPVGEPDAAALTAYFETNKAKFGAPEYRKLGVLTLDPASLADPASVTADEVAAEYKRRIDSFTTPERRRIEQIPYKDAAAAEAALAKAKAGTDFATLATEAGVAPASLDLGLKTKAEVIDPTVADAAFAAAADTPVAVTDKAIQPSLIRVTAIEAGSVVPQSQAEPKLRQDIATRNARDKVQDAFDAIEDERAGGATLEEVAKSRSLPYRVIAAVAKDGSGPDGKPVADVPDSAKLLPQAFDSDVGVENNAIREPSGSSLFYEVLDITPARDRTLDEVRPQVIAGWQTDETANRVAEKANLLLGRLQKGEGLAVLAAEIGKPVETFENVRRGAPPQGLSANAAAQAFAGPQGHVANADGLAPPARTLLHVDQVTSPGFFAEAADAKQITAQIGEQIGRDILESYNRKLLSDRKTVVNQAVFAQISGAPRTQ